MDHLLLLLLLQPWSSGMLAEGKHNQTESDAPLRLVGGASRCAGTLQMNYLGEWIPVVPFGWYMKDVAALCEHLDCGSAVLGKVLTVSQKTFVWRIERGCDLTKSTWTNCPAKTVTDYVLNLNCSGKFISCISDSVRLLHGTSQCSGRLEVKTDHTDQLWSPVCDAAFDLQDAQVVCRQLGCGAPSLLQGALYGEVQAPVWSPEFQCGGQESALLDCRSSGSVGNSCSPGKAVGLTCSDPVDIRLVGGASRCAGSLQLKPLGEWTPVDLLGLNLKETSVFCEHLDCGSAVSVKMGDKTGERSLSLNPFCVLSGSPLIDCVTLSLSYDSTELMCSDSVRLLHGTSRCSGRLEVKTDHTDQLWSPVCDAAFDLQDARVVCRQLGCGAPSLLQGGLYGEVQAPVWSPEFQCGGHESALQDCRSSGSVGNSCSPGKAVGLTCSDPVDIRLVGGASRCAGTLQLKHRGEWTPVDLRGLNLKETSVICEHLDCGSAVSVRRERYTKQLSLFIDSSCVSSGSSLIDCATLYLSIGSTELMCADLLFQPITSVSSSFVGVSEDEPQGRQVIVGSAFNISCSIQPQYPGGSFQLIFTSSSTWHNSTQEAVNHSAHFLFAAAEPAHQGNYSCVYHLHVSDHDFSSESPLLSLSVSYPTYLRIRWVVLPLLLLLQLLINMLWFHWKTKRIRRVNSQRDVERVICNHGDASESSG